ncbi:hypothetical protein NBRC116494_22480 [Aurantivibrio plasticivorans]
MKSLAAMSINEDSSLEHLDLAANQAKNEQRCADFFYQLLLGQRRGHGCLPNYLGLSEATFNKLLLKHFSHSIDVGAFLTLTADRSLPIWRNGEIREELMELRAAEIADLVGLLTEHRASNSEWEHYFAKIVAAGCLGGEHLWKDLGLATRAELRELLTLMFPTLVSKNVKDMRWKRFFYKQLCEQEGGYVCRAPTCEECSTYDECFGPED